MLEDGTTQIEVALTTTKHIIVNYDELPLNISMICDDIPVCVADMKLVVLGVNEKLENFIAESLKKAIGAVFVYPEKRSLFIGKDPSSEKTGMIIYEESQDTIYANDFFKRWSETKQMYLELKVFNHNIIAKETKKLFCLKGLWVKDKWVTLNVDYRDSFTILEDK